MKRVKSLVAYHFLLLVVFTSLMFWVKNGFYINEELSHPQFGSAEEYAANMEVIYAKGKQVWYYGFFLTDFIWSLVLLSLFPHIVFRMNGQLESGLLWLISSAILAWLLDAAEGLVYVSGWNLGLLDSLLWMKLIAYGLTIAVFILLVSVSYYQRNKN